MTFSEALFLRLMEELKKRLNGDGYDYIRACGIIRHLLIDQHPLVTIINRNYKVKISFKVRKPKIVFDGIESIRWSSLNPIADDDYIFCDKQTFLSRPVCQYLNHVYSVKEIVLYAAHIMGGVHSGKPKTNKEKIYLEIQNTISLNGNSIYSESSHSIMEVVIDALEPLELFIKSHTPAGGL